MAFVTRKIDVTIILGEGDFGDQGQSDQVKLTGLRVSASINKDGLPSMDSATIRVWGLTKSLLNKLTQLGKPIQFTRTNTVIVEAGDDQSGMSQVFQGTIWTSYADFSDMPNVPLVMTCMSGAISAAKPVKPISFPNGADVSVIMQQIGASMTPVKSVQNFGVNTHLAGALYYPGTALDQMKAVAQAANCNADASGSTLDIWPIDGVRGSNGSIPEMGPDSGLIGYPTYSDYGISIRSLYQPGLVRGGNFTLKTSVTQANGSWTAASLAYDLESETPDGHWFMNINAYRPTDPLGATS